jgi:hypothetical protein
MVSKIILFYKLQKLLENSIPRILIIFYPLFFALS